MKIDLPSLQSIENEKGGSFIAIRSIIMEGIYLWNELIYIDIPNVREVILNELKGHKPFENVKSSSISSIEFEMNVSNTYRCKWIII